MPRKNRGTATLTSTSFAGQIKAKTSRRRTLTFYAFRRCEPQDVSLSFNISLCRCSEEWLLLEEGTVMLGYMRSFSISLKSKAYLNFTNIII